VPRDYSKYINRPGYQLPAGYDLAKYPRMSATADMVILSFFDQKLNVLLVRRKNNPFQGYWAIPGGFVEQEEDLAEAASRELLEETGIKKIKLQEFGAFGHPHRDPRTRTVTIAYLALIRKEMVRPKPGSDAADVAWFPALKPPELAFDHELVLQKVLMRLRELSILTPSLFQLLPRKFSLSELAGLCREVFREKIVPKTLGKNLKLKKLIKPAGKGFYVLVRKNFSPASLGFVIANPQ